MQILLENAMKHVGLVTWLVLLGVITSCDSTGSTRPVATTELPRYVKGTYMPGSNITEPRPRESQFFQTEHAGFIVSAWNMKIPRTRPIPL